MNLLQIVNYLRKINASLGDIELILALIEIDAINTPFFYGLKNEELIYKLYNFIINENIKYNDLNNEMTFINFLARSKIESGVLYIKDLNYLNTVIEEIETKGVSYEFTKFS